MEPTEVKLELNDGNFNVRSSWSPDMVSASTIPQPQWLYQSSKTHCKDNEEVFSNNDINTLFNIQLSDKDCGVLIAGMNELTLELRFMISYDYLLTKIPSKSNIALESILDDIRVKAKEVLRLLFIEAKKSNVCHFNGTSAMDGTELLWLLIKG